MQSQHDATSIGLRPPFITIQSAAALQILKITSKKTPEKFTEILQNYRMLVLMITSGGARVLYRRGANKFQ